MRCEYHKHYEQGTLVSKIEETRQNNVYFKSKQNGIAEAVRLKLCHCYAFMRTLQLEKAVISRRCGSSMNST